MKNADQTSCNEHVVCATDEHNLLSDYISQCYSKRAYTELVDYIRKTPKARLEPHLSQFLESSSVNIRVALIEKGFKDKALVTDTQQRVIESLIRSGHILESMYETNTKSIKELLITHGDYTRFINDELATIRSYIITKKFIFEPFVNDDSYLVLSRLLVTAARDQEKNRKWINKVISNHLNAGTQVSKQVLSLALREELELELLASSRCKCQVTSTVAKKKLGERYQLNSRNSQQPTEMAIQRSFYGR